MLFPLTIYFTSGGKAEYFFRSSEERDTFQNNMPTMFSTQMLGNMRVVKEAPVQSMNDGRQPQYKEAMQAFMDCEKDMERNLD